MEHNGSPSGSADAPGGGGDAPRANHVGGVVLVIGSGVMGARIAAWLLVLGQRVRIWAAANKFHGDTETSIAEAIDRARNNVKKAMQDHDELYMSAATAASCCVVSSDEGDQQEDLLAALMSGAGPFTFSGQEELLQGSAELWTRLNIQAADDLPGSIEPDNRSAKDVWLAIDCTRDPNTPEECAATATKSSGLLRRVHQHAPNAVLAIKHENIDPADIVVPDTPVIRLRFIKPVFFIPLVELQGDDKLPKGSKIAKQQSQHIRKVQKWLEGLQLEPVVSGQRTRLMHDNVLTSTAKRLMREYALHRFLGEPRTVEKCQVCLEPADICFAECCHRPYCSEHFAQWARGVRASDSFRHTPAQGCPVCRGALNLPTVLLRLPSASPEGSPSSSSHSPSAGEVTASREGVSFHMNLAVFPLSTPSASSTPALEARLADYDRGSIEIFLTLCPGCFPRLVNDINRARLSRPGFVAPVCSKCFVQPLPRSTSEEKDSDNVCTALSSSSTAAATTGSTVAPTSTCTEEATPRSSDQTEVSGRQQFPQAGEEPTAAQRLDCSMEWLLRAARLKATEKNTKFPNSYQLNAAIASLRLPRKKLDLLRFKISALNETRRPTDGVPITVAGRTVVDHGESSQCRQGMCQFLSVAAGLAHLSQQGQLVSTLVLFPNGTCPWLSQLAVAAGLGDEDALCDLADRLLECAVAHMGDHAEDFQDVFSLASIEGGGDGTYSQYLDGLLTQGWGDLLTLRALHNILGVAIHVHSTEEGFDVPVINPHGYNVHIHLGHVHGMHYVALPEVVVPEVPAPAAPPPAALPPAAPPPAAPPPAAPLAFRFSDFADGEEDFAGALALFPG